jgi:hypothetical protein
MTTTLRQFIVSNGLRMTCDWANENPNMNGMPAGSSHWKCLIRCGKRQMTVFFSMGPAHSREPELADVLDCLASDAASIENAPNFEDWASELGYDTDSRKAEKTFKVCQKQAEKLRQLLYTDEAYRNLLFNTERL